MSEQNYGWARVIPFTCAHFFPPPRTGEHNAVRVAFCGKPCRAINPAQFLSAEQCAVTNGGRKSELIRMSKQNHRRSQVEKRCIPCLIHDCARRRWEKGIV